MPRHDPAEKGAPLGKLYLVGYLPASRGELVPVLSGRRHTDATRRDLVRRLNLLGVPILADPPAGERSAQGTVGPCAEQGRRSDRDRPARGR